MATRATIRGLLADVPLVHGNGFILVPLRDGRRAHFWGDHRIPRQVVYSGIHNHRFSFESEVVSGRMVNICYYLDASERGSHVRHGLLRNGTEDTKLIDLGLPPVFPNFTNCGVYAAGSSYRMRHSDFHETFTPEPTITIIRKTESRDDVEPIVLAVKGSQPDNDFDRYAAPPELLRQIVSDMLG